LDRAKDDGIVLTAAGYLKPADVERASKIVPVMADWIGPKNREANCIPLLRFRESLQAVGLLRKNNGTLLLTKAGQSAQRDVNALWKHLAGRLIPKSGDKFETQATLLTLAYAAASANAELPLVRIAAMLTELGWRHGDGRPVTASALRHLPVYEVLINLTDQPVTLRRMNAISPAAAALARSALRG
ncbi:MAG: plasmid pRiA4b ORF-3 family protein, partial [Dietzia sp.]|nr:plasmid pRiA4b ORF-3 family protein [Dietzia sp.]